MTRAVVVVSMLAFAAACGGFDCEAKCNEPGFRSELVLVLQTTGQDVDENTICDKTAIEEAETCVECISAIETEFGVEPVDQAAFCE